MNEKGSSEKVASKVAAGDYSQDRAGILTKLLGTAILAFLLLLPLILGGNKFFIHLVNLIYHNIIILMGLLIILGFTKQFSLGQVAFYGIGAYANALLTARGGLNFFPAFVLAGGIAAIFSLVIAVPATRFKGPWLALVTFAFAEIARILFSRLKGLTGGFAGFFNIPHPRIFGFVFGNEFRFYYIFLFSCVLLVWLTLKLKDSPAGKKWLSIGDDENISSSIGINPFVQKLLAFSTGSFFAGVAGALYASYVNYLSPELFTLQHTLFYLTILVVGGLESIWGAVISVILFTIFQNYLRALYPWDMVLYGLIIILIVNLMPQGIGSKISELGKGLSKESRGSNK